VPARHRCVFPKTFSPHSTLSLRTAASEAASRGAQGTSDLRPSGPAEKVSYLAPAVVEREHFDWNRSSGSGIHTLPLDLFFGSSIELKSAR